VAGVSWVETRAHYDDGKLIFERVQDVEPILDHNKALQNTAQKRGDFRHIGTIPNVILEKWMNEEGAPVLTMSKDEFARFIRRKLNDPDWRHLRTDK
jgi:hypothetical protein